MRGSLAAEYDALAQAARTGSPEAATALFANLIKCQDQYLTHVDALGKLPPDATDTMRQQVQSVVTLCQGLSEAQLGSAGEWLELAAAAGDEQARIAYLKLAAPTHADAIKAPQKVLEFKQKAYRYLSEEAHSGSVEAMRHLSFALWDGDVFDKDPVLGYAYMQAAQRASGSTSRTSQLLLNQWAQKLTAEQMRQAMQQTDAILARRRSAAGARRLQTP